MNQFRIVADSSCDILSLDGADFVSVPLTIRTDTEEFRDDDFLDVNEMVTVLRSTKGRSYSACPNIADWTEAFGESAISGPADRESTTQIRRDGSSSSQCFFAAQAVL